MREARDTICVFTAHSSCHGESGEGDRTVLRAAETQNMCGLVPTRLYYDCDPCWLALKKRLLDTRSSQGLW